MSAVDRWADELAAWAIPDHLLEAVDESPYGWPQFLWARRSELARQETEEPVTTGVVRRLLPSTGTIVDIGAGRGRASLALAAEGHRVVAVEKSQSMADGLRADAAAMDTEVDLRQESWPEAAPGVGPVDVAMCAHVVYDVPRLGPFLRAMHDSAERGVVIELTDRHPWASLSPYYRRLHGLARPEGPTAEDLVDVVAEVVGETPHVERWSRSGQLWFESWDELVAFQARRLVLPPERRPELRALLEPDVAEVDGRLYFGPADRSLVTVWWER